MCTAHTLSSHSENQRDCARVGLGHLIQNTQYGIAILLSSLQNIAATRKLHIDF